MTTVLHVGKFYPPVSGGMERVVEMLCRSTRGLVNNSVLVMNTDRRTVVEEMGGVRVVRVGTTGAAGSVHVAPSFPVWLRRERADLMILHEPNPWALLSHVVARPRAPLFIWYHSDVVRPRLQYAAFYAPIARPVYGRAMRIVVSSPPLAEHSRDLQPYRNRVRVVPFGIEPSAWRPAAADEDAIAAIRREHGDVFVLFAGRHVPYKGLDVLVRALAGTTIRAVVAGDGPKRAQLEALARATTREGQVQFVGEVADERLRLLMLAAAVFVLPSLTRAEAFGYVQLEAMAAGVPVVSTDLPTGVPWVNRDGETGRVVRAGDSDSLRAALLELVADRTLRDRMGAAGRRRVEQEFTLELLGDRMRRLYEETGVLSPCPVAC
jgi:rhamnosyl/mannosyltransferase